jgi:OFA family oxalate/formate antiporter-like MFS transporter
MTDPARRRAAAALAAATVQNLPFGTIYAFSVFLKPMEAMLGIGRAQMAFVFALASISLTLGMLAAPRLYRRFPPVPLLLAAALASAAGLGLAAAATGYAQLLVGYGLLFGFGGGVAFVMMQQGVNQSLAAPSGLANGYVVSLYPLGAMLGAPAFGWAIGTIGLRGTIAALGAVVLAAGAIAAALVHAAGIRMQDPGASPADAEARRWDVFARLFAVFFLAAAAGLTVMSQSAGILQAYGAGTGLALGATSFITGAIAAARLGGGWLVDRFPVPAVGAGAHLLALCGAVLLLALPSPGVAVASLTMIGMGYGFISGSTAAAIARYWHRNAFGRVASQMYVGWCAAAVTLPLVAGWLYDRSQGYADAMTLAAGVNLLGALVSVTLPRRDSERLQAPPPAERVAPSSDTVPPRDVRR